MAKNAGNKQMTKSQLAATLAERAGISKKQAAEVLKAQADLAYTGRRRTRS